MKEEEQVTVRVNVVLITIDHLRSPQENFHLELNSTRYPEACEVQLPTSYIENIRHLYCQFSKGLSLSGLIATPDSVPVALPQLRTVTLQTVTYLPQKPCGALSKQ